MGLCVSAENGDAAPATKDEVAKDKSINKALNAEHRDDSVMKKLLLLGPGESGKTTFFKQIVLGHGKGFSMENRLEYKELIKRNIIEFGWRFGKWVKENSELLEGKVSEEESKAIDEMHDIYKHLSSFVFDAELAQKIHKLWKSPLFQKAWEEHRSKIQVPESCKYFLDKVLEIEKDSYLPDNYDILNMRIRTTGAISESFEIDGTRITLIDVGGQRSERRKWKDVFGDVTAVLFLVALGEYDQTIFENDDVNRMREALSVWEEHVNAEVFAKKTFLLFLNKEDIFRQKIKRVPLKVCFPEYKGENTYEEASAFIKEEFLLRVKDAEKSVFCHLTCATDSTKTLVVFATVKDTILRESLREADLLT